MEPDKQYNFEPFPITEKSRDKVREYLSELFKKYPMPIGVLEKTIKELQELGLLEYAEELSKIAAETDPFAIRLCMDKDPLLEDYK